MAEMINQVSMSAVQLTIFLFVASVFLASVAWAAIAVMRMLQIAIATDSILAKELAAIRQSLVATAPQQQAQPQNNSLISRQFSVPGIRNDKKFEGEILSSDDTELAEQETIRQLRNKGRVEMGGMTNDELEAEIEKVRQMGFVEE